MKKVVFTLLLVFSAVISKAQDTQTEYNFLRIPVSAHAAAVGGDNITLVENDATLMFSNPALLCNVSSKTIGLNYMNYMQGVNTLSASYNFDVLKRGYVGASVQYINYGSMKETTTDGTQTGTFHANDIAFAGYFAYLLTDKLSAGITAKFITSYIANYNSIGIGVDLGLNYYLESSEWSFSAVAKNLGGQVKAYNEDYEPMPIDIQIGVSKRIPHTPVRLNATLVNLNHWNTSFKKHIVLGADFVITKSIWLGLGYNFRRASEMSVGTGDDKSSHWAGISAGAGLNLEHIKVNIAWGKYHVASNSIMINLAYTL